MLELFIKDFKSAPLWQKILIAVLLGILFFHFFIRSSFVLFSNKIDALDKSRDKIFRELQHMRYLIEDEKIIVKNYQTLEQQIAKNLFLYNETKNIIQNAIIKNSIKVLSIDFAEKPLQEFNYSAQGQVKIQTNIFPAKLETLLSALQNSIYYQVKNIDYQNNFLNIEIIYFYRKNNNKLSNTPQKNPKKYISKQPKKNSIKNISFYTVYGFYKNNVYSQVIINNKLYKVGDKCGKYTIISISPEHKYIKLQYAKTIKLVSPGQHF